MYQHNHVVQGVKTIVSSAFQLLVDSKSIRNAFREAELC